MHDKVNACTFFVDLSESMTWHFNEHNLDHKNYDRIVKKQDRTVKE